MRKFFLILLLGIFYTMGLAAEERSVYVLVPGDLNPAEVKVSGIVKNGNATFTEAAAEVTLGFSEKYTAYGSSEYLKVSVAGLSDADEVKYMIGYRSGEENGVPRYTIVASSDIINNTDIQEAFDGPSGTGVDGINGLEMMDFDKISSYNDYTTFPGRDLTVEDSLVSGVVIGNQKMASDSGGSSEGGSGSSEPSNIVEIYYKKDPDSPYNVVDGGAGINPTAANQNSEFELWAIKVENGETVYTDVQRTDPSGQPMYFETSEGEIPLYEPERVLIYTSMDSDEKIILGGDLRSITFTEGDQAFPTDALDTAIRSSRSAGAGLTEEELAKGIRYDEYWEGYSDYKFDVRVRFKNANGESLDINGEVVELDSGSGPNRYQWEFYELDDVEIYFHGGQKFTFYLEGNKTIIIPGDGIEVPDPIAQKIYVMKDDGKFMEGEAGITSKYENKTKYRTSNIKMKVMKDNTITEKNFDIEDIEE